MSDQPVGQPTVEVPAESLLADIRQLPISAPFRWLARGADDLRLTGFRGCVYGLAFMLMGLAIRAVYATHWELTMALTAGFFLIGPFLCAGLYDLSRQREQGLPVDLGASLTCWRANAGAFGFFAVLLTLLLVFWARTSVVVFALFFTAELPTLNDAVVQILTSANYELIATWLIVGLAFATLAFAISVVSAPMILDRKADAIAAMFNSMRALYDNTATLAVWAVLIVLLIGASLVMAFLPLVLTAPLVGHATWHAYRDLVGAQQKRPTD
ncbi:MAG TPA: DUF2189 domain-containing protein [Burkholderiaceae bacterium]|nr:DUF2189 domain-containing protein [Burkholderiaceae bacterium]